MDAIIGRYVWSRAGRDKDQLFIIIDILDDCHVLVADGDKRPVDRPKKKKLKHLSITNQVAEEISQTVMMKKRLTDVDLRKAVQRYIDGLATYKQGEEV